MVHSLLPLTLTLTHHLPLLVSLRHHSTETGDVPSLLQRRNVLIGSAVAAAAVFAGGSAIRSLLSPERKDIESLVRSFPENLRGARRIITIPAAGSEKGNIAIALEHPPPTFERERMDPRMIEERRTLSQRCNGDIGNILSDLFTQHPEYRVRNICPEGFAHDEQPLMDAYLRGRPVHPVWRAHCEERFRGFREYLGKRSRGSIRVITAESRVLNEAAAAAHERLLDHTETPQAREFQEAFFRAQVARENHFFDRIAECEGDFVVLLLGKSHDAIDAFRRLNGRRTMHNCPPLSGVFIAPESVSDTFVDHYWEKDVALEAPKYHPGEY